RGHNVGRREGVRELLETLRLRTSGEEVVVHLERDALPLQLTGQPVVAVEPDTDVEGKMRADLDEHASAVWIVEIEIKERHMPPQDFDVIACFVVPGDTFGFVGLQDDGEAGAVAQLLEIGLD